MKTATTTTTTSAFKYPDDAHILKTVHKTTRWGTRHLTLCNLFFTILKFLWILLKLVWQRSITSTGTWPLLLLSKKKPINIQTRLRRDDTFNTQDARVHRNVYTGHTHSHTINLRTPHLLIVVKLPIEDKYKLVTHCRWVKMLKGS